MHKHVNIDHTAGREVLIGFVKQSNPLEEDCSDTGALKQQREGLGFLEQDYVQCLSMYAFRVSESGTHACGRRTHMPPIRSTISIPVSLNSLPSSSLD